MNLDTKYDYNFIIELEKNNLNIIDIIKRKDPDTFKLLEKTKMNILFLTLKRKFDISEKLCKQYRSVLVKAYSYFCV